MSTTAKQSQLKLHQSQLSLIATNTKKAQDNIQYLKPSSQSEWLIHDFHRRDYLTFQEEEKNIIYSYFYYPCPLYLITLENSKLKTTRRSLFTRDSVLCLWECSLCLPAYNSRSISTFTLKIIFLLVTVFLHQQKLSWVCCTIFVGSTG